MILVGAIAFGLFFQPAGLAADRGVPELVDRLVAQRFLTSTNKIGALYIDASGYPQLDASNNYVVGDPNPDWTGSLRTAFRFKAISVTGLLDIRHGGQNYNGTLGAMDHFGTSLESQQLRDGGNFIFGQTYLKGPVAGEGAGQACGLVTEAARRVIPSPRRPGTARQRLGRAGGRCS